MIKDFKAEGDFSESGKGDVQVSSYGFGEVALSVDDNNVLSAVVLSPDTARLLGMALIAAADKAESE